VATEEILGRANSPPFLFYEFIVMTALDFQNINKILIRTTNWLGDAVLTIPAMGQVRKAFPTSEITVVANPAVAEMLSNHPDCDRIIVWDKKRTHQGATGLLKFSSDLRQTRYNLSILFQNAIEAAIMVWLARIPKRLGYRTDARGLLLNYGIPIGAAERRLHHVDYYLNMLRQAGINLSPNRPRLYCSEVEIQWAQEQLSGENWVAVNIGAAYGSAKRWLPERFAEMATRICEELKGRVVLIGSHQEAELGNQISKAIRGPHLNLIGKTSIRQLMALLTQCRLLVTNDSGPMHIAAALDVPILALFGPTDHLTTSPVTDYCRIVRHPVDCAPCLKRHCPTDHRCMTSISVGDVLEAIGSLWDVKL